MLWLTLLITVVLTSLIVWVRSWIIKNREKHPGIYEKRGVFGTVLYVILNLGDLL